MIDAITFVPLFSAFAHLFILSYVFGQRQKNATSRAFLLFSGGFCAVSILEFLMRLPLPPATLLFYAKCAMLLFLLTTFSFLYFVHTVIKKPPDIVFKVILATIIVSVIASFFFGHHRFIESPVNSGKLVMPTFAFIPFFLVSMLNGLRGMALLYWGWKKSRMPELRKQCGLLFWGVILNVPIGAIILILFPIILNNQHIHKFSSLLSVFYMAFIYWAMTRHGLMIIDIDQIRKASQVLFHNVSDGIVVTDRTGTIVQINETARRLFTSSGTIKEFTQIENMFPDITFGDQFSNKKQSYQLNDEEKTIIVSHASINDKDSDLGFITVFRDISEQQRLEEEIARKNQIESLGRLAGGIAHDFNNQLAGIMGCADMLRMKLTDNASLFELADIIAQASHRSSDLTKQLLAFARKGKYQVVPLNIHDIISDVVVMLDHSIDKRIKVLQRFDSQATFINGDSSQLHNVFLNISLNSRDAMPQGGELVFRTQDVVIDSNSSVMSQFDISEGRYVLITVSDTGEGMVQSTQYRAFEPFFTTKEKGKGCGMGLSAAYGTIRSHDGAIAIDSDEGKGTIVSVYLPVTSETEAVKVIEAEQQISSSNLTILLIEDEKVVARTTTMMLEQTGHTVTVCDTGRAAIDQYKKTWQETDLIILDLILPDISGYQTFTEMKSINPDLRVLLSSGYSVNSEVQRILDEGAKDFLQKPYTYDELIQKIETLIRSN